MKLNTGWMTKPINSLDSMGWGRTGAAAGAVGAACCFCVTVEDCLPILFEPPKRFASAFKDVPNKTKEERTK